MKWAISVCVAFLGYSVPAQADILAIVISEDDLPYAMKSSNYDNSPSNYDNSSSNYDNAETTYDNAATTYENSSTTYENSASGKRNIYTQDGRRIGYYVFSDNGVLNFYNNSGRVFYMPSGGHTQSVFYTKGEEWCGTLGEMDGKTVLGVTRNCMLRMLME